MDSTLPTLISVTDLATIAAQPDLVILDCRYQLDDPDAGTRAFEDSHIPGAIYASLHRDLSGLPSRFGGRHPLPTPQQFEAFARAAGISANTRVVVYDDQRLAFAARAWWLFRYFGHKQVAVLDGGLGAWRDAGLAMVTGEGTPPAAARDFVASPRADMTVDYRDIHPEPMPGMQLVDAREPRRFDGEEEPIDPLAGHIPGAVNKPWKRITDEQGFVRDRTELEQHWADLPSDQRLVCYCGSGVTACVNLLSLYLAGRENTVLYPGSWSDWCAHILHPGSEEKSG
ncbi:sulfurtransferase [Microbulbifer sp. 2201CG32-9]|uniref:sulfurtransferase n=1 Tax=Microbulbifer sp. 2201CG32-9 TaxID=3232309 RepID=UPI00345BB070